MGSTCSVNRCCPGAELAWLDRKVPKLPSTRVWGGFMVTRWVSFCVFCLCCSTGGGPKGQAMDLTEMMGTLACKDCLFSHTHTHTPTHMRTFMSLHEYYRYHGHLTHCIPLTLCPCFAHNAHHFVNTSHVMNVSLCEHFSCQDISHTSHVTEPCICASLYRMHTFTSMCVPPPCLLHPLGKPWALCASAILCAHLVPYVNL